MSQHDYKGAPSAASSKSPEIIDNQNVNIQINGAKQSKIVITNVNINKVHPSSSSDHTKNTTDPPNYTILPSFQQVEFDAKTDLNNMDQYNPKIYKVVKLNALADDSPPSYEELSSTTITITAPKTASENPFIVQQTNAPTAAVTVSQRRWMKNSVLVFTIWVNVASVIWGLYLFYRYP